MCSRAWFISPCAGTAWGICVQQATQGCPINKRYSHSSRGSRKLPSTPFSLPTKIYFQVLRTPKQKPDFSTGVSLSNFSFALALAWMCWKFILLLLFSKWLFFPQVPVGSWWALRSHATWVTLMRCPKECHHLVAMHLATRSPSHLTAANRLGFRELVLYKTSMWDDLELFANKRTKKKQLNNNSEFNSHQLIRVRGKAPRRSRPLLSFPQFH